MNSTILNWNNADFRSVYLKQLKEQPLCYDPDLKIWVAYSYEYCKALLLSENAHVPTPFIDDNGPMNDKLKLLLNKLARISNGKQHLASRGATMRIYENISKVAVDDLLEQLLLGIDIKNEFDWVAVLGKQLPILVILKGLGFNEEDSAYITANLAMLVRVMLPGKTVEDIEELNPVVSRFYAIAEQYAVTHHLATGEPDTDVLMICNLIGLFIQCYDGGRGLLCNVLLSLAGQDKQPINKKDAEFYNKLVAETLRWDPPVHNTRRIANKDISLGSETIKAGETILIMLAAANLDDRVFKDPGLFDLMRSNNDVHLTFGAGGHNCIAKYFSIGLAVDTCRFLVSNFQNITILQKEFSYEPQLNVRLVKQLLVKLS